MQRLVIILTLLFVSVITTACINNFAVQELNSKAKEYLQQGDVEKAICRLNSSLDLDDSIFETNYNLGVAYIQAEKYEDAIKVLEHATQIDASIPDTFYSLAVAQENTAFEKISPKKEEIKDDETEISEKPEEKKELTTEDKKEVSELISSSIESYNKYLSLKPTAEDKDKINERINTLNEELKKYSIEENKEID